MNIISRAKRALQAFRATTPAYNSTGGGRATMGWNPGSEAVNALVAGGGDPLRRQSRDLIRRNPWAGKALNSFVGNAIGTGIVPIPKHPNPAVKAKLQENFLRWTDEADASGITDFYGLQSLACRGALEGGEVLGRLRFRRATDRLSVPLQIQLMEPEHLPLTERRDLANGNRVRWGIEFNGIGKRVAYHLYPEHPGEEAMFGNVGVLSRIPADYICHLYTPKRIGQHRGEPWLSPAILAFHELEKYDRAELVRKGIAAMFAMFGTKTDNSLSEFGQDEADSSGIPIHGIEPGTYYELPVGRDIKFSTPSDVGGMYTEFMRVQLRKIAAGLNITYEQLTGDLTGVNYSSIRAGLLEFRRACEAWQHQVMVFQFCRPVWAAWVEAAALVGKINAADYAAHPDFYGADWQPPAWPWVDPLKDMQAEVLAIDNLLKPREHTIKGMGFDPEAVDEAIQREQQREEELGLKRGSQAESPGGQQRENDEQQTTTRTE